MTEATKPITAESIETTTDALIIHLTNEEISVPWSRCSRRLAAASETERRHVRLSPGGYGIHWPLIDEDLSVGGLVEISRGG